VLDSDQTRPTADRGGLEFGCDFVDGFGQIPHADDLNPAQFPIHQDVVLAEPTGTSMDRPNVGAVRLDHAVDAVARDINAKYPGNHWHTLRAVADRLSDELLDVD
jgi:hypothetical protein